MDPANHTGMSQTNGFGRKFSNSLLARYTLVTAALLVTIIGLISWVYVQHTRDKDRVSRSIQAAQDIQQTSTEIRSLLWQAEFSLSQFLISPSPALRERTSRYIYSSVEQLETLGIENSLVSADKRFYQLSADIQFYLAELSSQTENLVAVRVDREAMFPAMPVIVETMFPANEQFATANRLLLEEIQPETHLHAVLAFKDLEHLR